MQPNAKISWPVAYVDLGDSRSFMIIEEHEWKNDVDTRYAIGPAGSASQFLVDTEGEVFSISCTSLGADNPPEFRITPSTRKLTLDDLKEHVVAWLRDEGIEAAIPEKLLLKDLVSFVRKNRDAGGEP